MWLKSRYLSRVSSVCWAGTDTDLLVLEGIGVTTNCKDASVSIYVWPGIADI